MVLGLHFLLIILSFITKKNKQFLTMNNVHHFTMKQNIIFYKKIISIFLFIMFFVPLKVLICICFLIFIIHFFISSFLWKGSLPLQETSKHFFIKLLNILFEWLSFFLILVKITIEGEFDTNDPIFVVYHLSILNFVVIFTIRQISSVAMKEIFNIAIIRKNYILMILFILIEPSKKEQVINFKTLWKNNNLYFPKEKLHILKEFYLLKQEHF
jgi:hypothetical protein